MRIVARLLAVTGVLTLGLAGRATGQDAQGAPERHGAWFGVGLGIGELSRTCDNCPNAPGVAGVTAYLKVGATPDPQMQVGIELAGWRKNVQGTMVTSGSGLIVFFLYPVKTVPFFLKGGLGGSLYREDVSGVKPPSDTSQTTGFAITVGLGYERRIGAHLDVTPVANFLFGSLGNIRPGGVFLPGVQQTIVQLALGVKVH